MAKLNWDRVRSESWKPTLPPESDYNPLRYSYDHCTRRQREYVYMLLNQRGLLNEQHLKNVPNLTVSQCSSFINQLKKTRALPAKNRACPNERVLPDTVLPPNHRRNPAPDENAGL